MPAGKRRARAWVASERQLTLEAVSGARMVLTFRVADDSVAFRYSFPDASAAPRRLKSEADRLCDAGRQPRRGCCRTTRRASGRRRTRRSSRRLPPALRPRRRRAGRIPHSSSCPQPDQSGVQRAMAPHHRSRRGSPLGRHATGRRCARRGLSRAAAGSWRGLEPGRRRAAGDRRVDAAVARDPHRRSGHRVCLDGRRGPQPTSGGRLHVGAGRPRVVRLVDRRRRVEEGGRAEGVRRSGGGDGLGVLAHRRQLAPGARGRNRPRDRVREREEGGPLALVQLGRPAQRRHRMGPTRPHHRAAGPARRVRAPEGAGHRRREGGLLAQRQAVGHRAVPRHDAGRRRGGTADRLSRRDDAARVGADVPEPVECRGGPQRRAVQVQRAVRAETPPGTTPSCRSPAT